MFIINIEVYDTRIALHREIIYLLYCSYSLLNTCCTYRRSYTITALRTDIIQARTAHGRARTLACACHGRTDVPRTFPVARRMQDHALGCGHLRDIRDEAEPLRPLDLYYRCTSRRAGYRLVIRATLGLVAHNSSGAHSDVAGRSMSYEYRLYSTSPTSFSLTFTGDICVLHWQT